MKPYAIISSTPRSHIQKRMTIQIINKQPLQLSLPKLIQPIQSSPSVKTQPRDTINTLRTSPRKKIFKPKRKQIFSLNHSTHIRQQPIVKQFENSDFSIHLSTERQSVQQEIPIQYKSRASPRIEKHFVSNLRKNTQKSKLKSQQRIQHQLDNTNLNNKNILKYDEQQQVNQECQCNMFKNKKSQSTKPIQIKINRQPIVRLGISRQQHNRRLLNYMRMKKQTQQITIDIISPDYIPPFAF